MEGLPRSEETGQVEAGPPGELVLEDNGRNMRDISAFGS